MDTKLLSRKWVYENIFDFSDEEKKKYLKVLLMMLNISLDWNRLKQKEKILQQNQEQDDEGEDDDPNEQPRKGDWGGSEKSIW